MPVGNATTVVGSTKIVYGLGNITNLDASSVGEIIPVHTEESVIKYYYHNKDGNLVEIQVLINILILVFLVGQDKNLLSIMLINTNN